MMTKREVGKWKVVGGITDNSMKEDNEEAPSRRRLNMNR